MIAQTSTTKYRIEFKNPSSEYWAKLHTKDTRTLLEAKAKMKRLRAKSVRLEYRLIRIVTRTYEDVVF